MIVALSLTEMRLAADAGVSRRLSGIQKGLRSAAGYSNETAWDVDILGAMGEMAFAKAHGIYWVPTIDVFKVPDVGNVYVRTTRNSKGRLIVRAADPEGLYALVIAKEPRFRIAGTYWASEARADKTFLAQLDPSRPPAFAVPQERLIPADVLMKV